MEDFSFGPDIIFEAKKQVNIYRVFYKKECIAFFREADLLPGRTYKDLANEYVSIYGYMAEYRRLWNNGDHVNWSENLRVT